MRVKQTLKQWISWLLIIVLIIPNIAFAEGETPVVETEVFSIQVFDPVGATKILDFSTHVSRRTQGTEIDTFLDNDLHTFKVLSATDGEYALYFSSVQTDTYAFNEPFVFYVIGGKAYSSATPSGPEEIPSNLITGTVNVNLREGLLVGKVTGNPVGASNAGNVSVEQIISENQRDWIAGFEAKADGSIFLPKVDGSYAISVGPQERFIKDYAFFSVNIAGEIVTGYKEMQFPVVQLSGQVFEKRETVDTPDIPITNYDYSVEVVDANGNHVKYASGFDNNGEAFYYKLSQLDAGDYNLILHPGEYYASQGYVASLPVPFTLDSSGVATPLTIDLTLRKASDLPLELRYNHVQVVPSNRAQLDVNFDLFNSGVTNLSDITCELIRMGPNPETGTDIIIYQKLLDSIMYGIHGVDFRDDGVVNFWALYDLEDYELVAGETYILKVNTPKGFVQMNLFATDKMILQGTDYLGTAQETIDGVTKNKVYHHVGLINSLPVPFDVTIYDEDDIVCGTGTIDQFKGQEYNYILKSDINEGAIPRYIEMEMYVKQTDYSNTFTLDSQNYFSFVEITSDDTHYSLKLYNQFVTAETIQDLQIKQLVDNVQTVVFSTADSTTEQVLPISDLMGGIEFKIPLEAFSGNNWYDLTVKFNDGKSMDRGPFYIENKANNIFEYTIKTPSGDPFVGEYSIWYERLTQGEHLNYGYQDGILYAEQLIDGPYAFVFSSDEADSYAISEKVFVYIKDGICYSDPEMLTQFTAPVEVTLREGLLVGYATNQSGIQTRDAGHIGIDVLDEPNNWIYQGGMKPKPNGAIFMPKVDGQYIITLYPWGPEAEQGLISDRIEIEITGDEVLGQENLKLNPTQVSGTVNDHLGNNISNWDFWIQIRDEAGEGVSVAMELYENETEQFYRLGGLPAGNYTLVLHPGNGTASQGHISSDPIPFTVDDSGVATPSTINLSLKHVNNMTLELVQNNIEFVPANRSEFMVNVDLRYSKATAKEDIQCRLMNYNGPGNEDDEIIPLPYIAFEDQHYDLREDSYSNYRATYDLGPYNLKNNQTYVLEITDGSLDPITQSPIIVSSKVTVTSDPIIYWAQYVGTTDGFNYHLVAIENAVKSTYDIHIMNAQNVEVGTGTLSYDVDYSAFVMKSTIVPDLEPSSKPVYYTVDPNVVSGGVHMQNAYADDYSIEPQNYDSLTRVTSDADNYYYDIYNVGLLLTDVLNFKLTRWTETGKETVFPNSTFPNFSLEALTDRMGGVRITIPKAAIDANQFYDASFTIRGEDRYLPGKFFEDASKAALTGRLTSPDGTLPITDFHMWGGPISEVGNFNLQIHDDQFVISSIDTPGEYQFNIFSASNDTYASAALFNFWVDESGIAFSDEAMTLPITSEVVLKLREGILAAHVATYDNLPPSYVGYLNLNRILPDQSLEWVSGMIAKPDGSVYIPFMEGTYRLTLNPFDEFTDIVGQRAIVIVQGGKASPVATLGYHDVQIFGDVYESFSEGNGTYVENYDCNILIKNTAGDVFLNGFYFYEEKRDRKYYKIGGLAEGAYTVQLIPSDYYLDRGFTPSEPVSFTVNAAGVASIDRQDLTLTWFDVKKPVLVLAGEKVMTIPYGSTFVDPGYMVYDDVTAAEAIVRSIDSTVNTEVVGTYTITYTMTDEAGNVAVAVRTVHVVDTILPTLSIQKTDSGELPAAIKVIGDKINFKVVAMDDYNTSNITTTVTMNGTTITGIANAYSATLMPGINYLKVVVKDQSGNTVQKTIEIDNALLSLTANLTTLTNQNVSVTAVSPNGMYGNLVVGPNLEQTASANSELVFTANTDGLTTPKSFTYKVTNIDKTAPQAPVLTAATTNLTNQPIYLTMTGSDMLQYQLGSGGWLNYVGAIKVSANTTVNSRAIDGAGNVTSGNAIVVNWIDQTAPVLASPPELKVNGTPFNGSQKVKSGDVLTVVLSATDNMNNLRSYLKFNDQAPIINHFTSGQTLSIPIALPSQSAMMNKITIWIEDEAGNRLAFSENVFVLDLFNNIVIDVKAPTMSLIGGPVTIPVGSPYIEAGVSVYDDLDGATLVPVIAGAVNTSAVGVYTVTYDVSDSAGNASPRLTRQVTIVDFTKPMITTSLVTQSVSKSALTFTAKATDNHQVASFTVTQNGATINGVAGAGGNPDSYTVNLTEGENTFILSAKDPSNNTSTLTYKVTFVRPPSGQPVISASTLAPTNKPIVVTIDYPEGAFEKFYALNGNTNWQSYTAPLSITNAVTTINAVARQTAQSNLSTVASLVLNNYDVTLPSVPIISLSNTALTKNDVTVTLAGEGTVYYSLGQAIDVTGTMESHESYQSYQIYEQPFTVSQNVKIYAVSVDAAMNHSAVVEKGITNIDKFAPIGTVNYATTAPTRGSILATLEVNEAFEMASGTLRYHEFTSNGAHVFNFTDMAGNAGSVTAVVGNIDNVAPVVISSGALKQNSVPAIVKGGDVIDVTIIVKDASSISGKLNLGTAVIDLPLVSTPTGNPNEVRLSGQLVVPSSFSGTQDLKAIVKDATGNQVSLTLLSALKIDNVKPVFNVSLSNPVVNGFIRDAVLDLDIQNDGSTILYGLDPDTIDLPIDSLESQLNNPFYNDGQSHTIYFKATDAAGNSTDVKQLVFKWDSVAPQKPMIHLNVTSPTKNRTVTLDGTAELGTVVVKRTFTANAQTVTDTIYNGPAAEYLQGLSVELRQGLNHFEVTNIDGAGNVSEVGTLDVTFDGIAPLLDVTIDELGNITIRANEALAEVNYLLDDVQQEPLVFVEGVATIAPITASGDHILIIEGTDAAGNMGIGRLSFITVPTNLTTPKELSDGITMTAGTFTEAGQLNVSTFEVSAGQDMSFIGEPIKFELSGNSLVSPTNGVIVDVFIGTGYPVNTKLHYYNEGAGLWEALDANIDNGDSIYNDTLDSIFVTIDPTIANAIAIVDADATPEELDGATKIEVVPGHLLGFMRHFSGYAAIQDKTPPTLQVLTGTPSLPVSALTKSIEISVSEKSHVWVNGVKEVAVKNAGTYTYVMTLAEGVNTFTFKATDLAGLSSSTEHYIIERDTLIEAFTSDLSGVSSGSVVRSSTLVVNASATDKNFDKIEVNGALFKTTTVSKAVTLAEGSNAIQVVVTDKAGNSDSDTYSVTLDSTGPEVYVSGVSNGATIGGEILATITGNSDLKTQSWTLSNSTMSVSGTGATISYTAPVGSKDNYELIVDGFDAVGNMTRVTMAFVVDQEAPSIDFSAVDPVSNQSQTVVVSVSPMNADIAVNLYKNNVRVTNVSITPSDNVAQDTKVFTMTVSETGNYEVRVSAVNATTAASETLAFEIDKTVPVLVISGVAAGQTYVTQPTIVYSSIGADPVQATLTKTGSAATAIGNNYKVLTSGTYTLVVTSTDNASNTTTQTVNFTVTLPVIPGGGTGNGDGGNGGSTGGTLPVTPIVLPNIDDEKLVVTAGQKSLNFEEMGIDIQFTKTLMAPGTEVIVKRFDAVDVDSIIEMDTKNKMVFTLASQIFEFTASKAYEGDMAITLPYNPALVVDVNKLTVAWYDEALKTWVPMGGKIDKTNHTITFKASHFSFYTVLSGNKTFMDLKAYGWAKTAIETLASRGIVNGYDVQSFKPGSEITRAEFAAMIINALSMSKEGATMSFKDVKDEWYKTALEIAVSQSIISGYNGYLMPTNRITREEMAVMIINAYKAEKNLKTVNVIDNRFNDANKMKPWSIQSIALANELGIINGKSNNLFAPKSFANRAEAASMIYKLLQVLE